MAGWWIKSRCLRPTGTGWAPAESGKQHGGASQWLPYAPAPVTSCGQHLLQLGPPAAGTVYAPAPVTAYSQHLLAASPSTRGAATTTRSPARESAADAGIATL